MHVWTDSGLRMLEMETVNKAEKARNSRLLRAYGIDLADYGRILAVQDGRCAICGQVLAHNDNAGRRPEVDHDHRLKGKQSVRGILCGGRYAGCNRKIGRIDRPEWLRAVVAYLENPPARQALRRKSKKVLDTETGRD